LKKKILLQVLLLSIILIICLLFYNKYFFEKKITKTKILQKEEIEEKSTNNLIKNLRYDVKFENDTQYIITSDLSEITYIDNKEVVLMQEVDAIFKDQDGSILSISSSKAIFNNSSYNTIFEEGIKISYLDNIIKSQKLILNFEENIVTISDNIIYEGGQGLMKTDNITIDLISKNVEIFMNNNNDKVEIESK
tara:strand:- start:83 stop:661 length:579 start_codon:yes stop_codon:yes gene_type:complete